MGAENREQIKITDRRHFHADGTPRSEMSGEETDTFRPSVVSAPQPEPGSAPTREPAELPVFLEFLAGLVGGAASYLGLAPHPASGKAEVDLDGAKHMINILTALQDKTKGNLAPSEKEFLDNALTELRLVYVRLASQPK